MRPAPRPSYRCENRAASISALPARGRIGRLVGRYRHIIGTGGDASSFGNRVVQLFYASRVTERQGTGVRDEDARLAGRPVVEGVGDGGVVGCGCGDATRVGGRGGIAGGRRSTDDVSVVGDGGGGSASGHACRGEGGRGVWDHEGGRAGSVGKVYAGEGGSGGQRSGVAGGGCGICSVRIAGTGVSTGRATGLGGGIAGSAAWGRTAWAWGAETTPLRWRGSGRRQVVRRDRGGIRRDVFAGDGPRGGSRGQGLAGEPGESAGVGRGLRHGVARGVTTGDRPGAVFGV